MWSFAVKAAVFGAAIYGVFALSQAIDREIDRRAKQRARAAYQNVKALRQAFEAEDEHAK